MVALTTNPTATPTCNYHGDADHSSRGSVSSDPHGGADYDPRSDTNRRRGPAMQWL